jgi:hypothetical protein
MACFLWTVLIDLCGAVLAHFLIELAKWFISMF